MTGNLVEGLGKRPRRRELAKVLRDGCDAVYELVAWAARHELVRSVVDLEEVVAEGA